jgi:putative holliday junction resolvase
VTTGFRALGLDFGERRVGVAVSDALGIAATPLEVIEGKTPEQVAQRVAALAKDKGATVLVVGLPINMDGTEHKSLLALRAKAEMCGKAAGLPVEFVDERLTTVEAGRRLWESGLTHKDRKSRVDRVAAALILQSWLQQKQAAARRAALPSEEE